MIADYQVDFHTNPESIILGPIEYMHLSYYLNNLHSKNEGSSLVFYTEYNGIPVRIKETPGIELETNVDIAILQLSEQFGDNNDKSFE
jgi:hypothetical protein